MTIGNRTRLTLPSHSSVHGAFSSIGRALVCGTRGYGFEPRKAPQVHHNPRRTRDGDCRFRLEASTADTLYTFRPASTTLLPTPS